MKLWDKGIETHQRIETFTVGLDRELDRVLAPYDILGTLAHTQMLQHIGLLSQEELKQLKPALKELYKSAQKGELIIQEGVEDIHSQVELLLTRQLGDLGKKVHSGRSRNDQVLVDLKLFFRQALQELIEEGENLFQLLLQLSEQHRHILLPGYTHLQVAMPSSFGLWFGSYAESLIDDVHMIHAAWKVVDQNPLGSAAGYGSSFPLDREMTTRLLGFEDMAYNVVYAQMGRGKTEQSISFAISSLAATLNKMAADICLYMSQNFAFVSFPDELTTGSSIMPHKKNPDVFEIMRARTNRLIALPGQLSMITSNLQSGYHRDLQLTKELILPALDEIRTCLNMTTFMLQHIRVNDAILNASIYDYLFSVEEVNKLVLSGIPFREAYRQIGAQIEAGNFQPERQVAHSHAGSIGQLSHTEVRQKWQQAVDAFPFARVEEAIAQLLLD